MDKHPDDSGDLRQELEQAKQQALIYGMELAALYKAERARHARLRAIIDNMAEGLLLAGSDQRVTEANARAISMLGKSYSEVLDVPLHELLMRPALERELQAMLDRQETISRFELQPGRVTQILEAAVANTPGTGVWTVLLRDVTEERRTANMRREIINLLAHELRTPLSILIGMQRLLETPQDEFRDEALSALRSSIERLQHSIAEVLSVADARANHIPAAWAELDLRALLRSICDNYSSKAKEKKVNLLIHIAERIPLVSGDGELLARACEELLNNAIAFTPAEGSISVELQPHGDSVELTIEDDGPGISEAERERVFQPFYQVGDLLTRKREGMGLGLTLARRTAGLHGGEVRIEDPHVRRGARVVLRVPAIKSDEKDELERLRGELDLARQQNLAFASDLARTYSVERQKTQVLSRTQDQLARSAKLATLGQMVAAIAHDVGNMISPIGGYADLLLMSPGLPEHGLKYAERIQQASTRAANMLRSLTDFGSDRGGKRASVKLENVIKAASALLEYNMTRKGIKIVTDLEADLPPVMANAGQLEQVLVNLMVNAQHAMESKGGGELHLGLKRCRAGIAPAIRKGSGSMRRLSRKTKIIECVRLSVTDQGDGIPEAVLERIFEPFFTTKEKGKGTGLGLFICYDIIEQHGGMIDVESATGVGTTFSITLPAQDASTIPVESATP